MNSDTFNFSLEAKLEKLFNEYHDKLPSDEQKKIVREGFVYSKVDPSAKILVMGINPSMRTDFLNADLQSYDYSQNTTDRYFKKFHTLLADFESFGITYCDLFYQRHTEQKQIAHFLSDNLGRAFLREQLRLTKETIEYISPRLILLFNRQGAQFFSPDWMEITIQETTDLQNRKKIIYPLVKFDKTKTLVYYSAFLGYRTVKATIINLRKDLPNLLYILKEVEK